LGCVADDVVDCGADGALESGATTGGAGAAVEPEDEVSPGETAAGAGGATDVASAGGGRFGTGVAWGAGAASVEDDG
jgi:hypothetical protein